MLLRTNTPPEWVECVLNNFDAFLIDHASCERKASAVGMSFVVRYPDRTALLEPMINFAREELEHFHQVCKLIFRRGLTLAPDEPDSYVNLLMKQVRFGRDERFLDRLLVSGIIEARGTEKLELVAQALTDSELKAFYHRLAKAEDHHKRLFVDLALQFFTEAEVFARLDFWLDQEAKAFEASPIRPAVH